MAQAMSLQHDPGHRLVMRVDDRLMQAQPAMDRHFSELIGVHRRLVL
jgi:hypothetical protein